MSSKDQEKEMKKALDSYEKAQKMIAQEKFDKALKESMRVTRKYLIWRTPIGDKANYMIKMVLNNSFEKLRILTLDREDLDYGLYMLFTKEYIKDLVEYLGGSINFIEKDRDFKNFDNTTLPEFEHVPATKTLNGMQINGNIILDWQYVVINCSNS